MSDPYQVVDPGTPVSQGDVILACPLLGWGDNTPSTQDEASSTSIDLSYASFQDDVIVMTQACDLEQGKAMEVVLCPCLRLSAFKEQWKEQQRRQNRTTKPDAWKALCGNIAKGYATNLAMLDPQADGAITSEHRVVQFDQIYTLPREAIDNLLKGETSPRLRLVSPFREHLAQAFARFFMRVALPGNRPKAW